MRYSYAYSYFSVPHIVQWDILMYILSYPFLILYNEIFLCIFLVTLPHIVQWDILMYIFLFTRSLSCKRMCSCVHILTYPFFILYREIFLCTYSYLPVPHLVQGDILVDIFSKLLSVSTLSRYCHNQPTQSGCKSINQSIHISKLSSYDLNQSIIQSTFNSRDWKHKSNDFINIINSNRSLRII